MPVFRSFTVTLDPVKPPPKFENGEKVLCFHGPLIYEGKILKTEFRKDPKEYAYWIHYAGWSKSWDEWVMEKRVLKYTETNLERQRDLKQAHEEQLRAARKAVSKATVGKKKSTLGSDTASVVSASDSRSSTPILDQKGPKIKKEYRGDSAVEGDSSGRKRKRSEYVESEAAYSVKQEVHINLPEELKLFLVDDWDTVVRQRRLVKLPARHSVEQILEDYLKTRKRTDMYAVELCNGIREYFNCMINAQLLYRYEREQFQDIFKQYQENPDHHKKQMSEIYGITHLLRLFTRIGGCLSYTHLDVEAVIVLQKCLDEFLKFLLKNHDVYFSLNDYGVSDPEYQRQIPA